MEFKHFKVILPPVIGGLYLYIPAILGYEHAEKLWSLLTGYVIPPLGKESIIPLGISVGIDPILLLTSIIIIDFLAGLFVYWNYDLIKKVPYLAKALNRVESKAKKIVGKKWVGNVWWIGLTLFMIIPFQGTGAATASVIGRMLGVKWKVLVVVLVGSIISSVSITFASETILANLLP
ncbi:MAG: small multi-drug export protein [Nitrososphaerales archaeon]